MQTETVSNLVEYISIINTLADKSHYFLLFRGQSDNDELLPNIAREDKTIDTSKIEATMLSELRRRGQLLFDSQSISDLNLLVHAQHFGMKTRLLDWSSNPLTALWFAIHKDYKLKQDSFVYAFFGPENFLAGDDTNPFEIEKTQVVKPHMNNERIVAQNGWFTIHYYSSKDKRFVPLEKNKNLKANLVTITIPATTKVDLLKQLSRLGVNARTVFPDLNGMCQHLNWKYTT